MGNTSSVKLLPQAQRNAAWRLSSAQEAEKQSEMLKAKAAAQEGATPNRKFPSLGKPNEEMVANMHKIMGDGEISTAISTGVDKNAMPEGAFNPGAKRKLAGMPGDVKGMKRMPLYGVTEPDLKSLFEHRGGVFAGNGGDVFATQLAAVVDSQTLAKKFKLRDSDVQLLLRYVSPVVAIEQSNLDLGDDDSYKMSNRIFDTTPNA